MSEISSQIGRRIRSFRRKQGMTLEELAAAVHKSKSTLSKYEKGEISVDIDTFYELAGALHIHVEQLLYCPPGCIPLSYRACSPAFFAGVSQFYSCFYDGRSKTLIRCVFDVLSLTEENRFKVIMYMNFADYASYQNSENTYRGCMEHYDAVTNIQLTNQDLPMERASVQILASSLDSDTKWGLFNGFSTRPMMPIAAKMLFSRTRLAETTELLRRLQVSRDDIRLLKLYNMLSVT